MTKLLAAIVLTLVGDIAYEGQPIRTCVYRHSESAELFRFVILKEHQCPSLLTPGPLPTPPEAEEDTSA